MAAITKPTDINKIWASSGDILAPSDSKISTGWQVEIPPRQYFNYIDNKQDKAIAHINQMGIAVWDNTTEYQYNLTGIKSLCMGSDGTIYRALQTHQNQDPISSVGYWEVAFSSAGDFYTQVQSDARYLQKTANLSDLTNTAAARTSLSVYSQAQTYTKTEVDGKTTVASVGQAQAQLSNTVLISPLKLGEAFQGANQSTAASGHQKLPGGLILQWTTVVVTTGSSFSVALPIPFPTGCLFAGAGEVTEATGNYYFSQVVASSTTSLTVAVYGGALGSGPSTANGQTVKYFALGF